MPLLEPLLIFDIVFISLFKYSYSSTILLSASPTASFSIEILYIRLIPVVTLSSFNKKIIYIFELRAFEANF